MVDSDQNVSLKDRYETLKLLCRDQILANEVLKDEVERLQKSYAEISRHRAFLLDKFLSQQRERSSYSELPFEKKERLTKPTYLNKRDLISQRQNQPKSYSHMVQRNKDNLSEQHSLDGSDLESDSWLGDYDNQCEDNIQLPSYRRTAQQHKHAALSKKSRPSPSMKNSPFKKPRLGGNGNTNSRDRYIQSNHSQDYSPSSELSDDFSEEPPVIYSSTKTKTPTGMRGRSGTAFSSGNNPSFPDASSNFGQTGFPQKRVSQPNIPSILRSPKSSAISNSSNQIYIQKPSVTGYNNSRMH